jgi:hypothetical protein
MNEVTFQEEQGLPTSQAVSATAPRKGLLGLVLKTGIVKTEAEANIVLIGIAVFSIIATVFVLLSGTSGTPQPTPEEIEALNEMMEQSGAGR